MIVQLQCQIKRDIAGKCIWKHTSHRINSYTSGLFAQENRDFFTSKTAEESLSQLCLNRILGSIESLHFLKGHVYTLLFIIQSFAFPASLQWSQNPCCDIFMQCYEVSVPSPQHACSQYAYSINLQLCILKGFHSMNHSLSCN